MTEPSGVCNTAAVVAAALEYAGYGWRVVPLADRGKAPRIREWQKKASTDEEQIAAWWEKWPEANIGVQLGERSGIIDVECDSQEAEEDLGRLFGGDYPVVPTFKASRGKHRLFKWRSDLPPGAVIHVGKVEIRVGNSGKGAQTVFPPSIHPSGARYEWLIPPGESSPLDLPASVLALVWNMKGEASLRSEPEGSGRPAKLPEYWDALASGGAMEGARNQSAAALFGKWFSLNDVFDSQAVSSIWTMATTWNKSNDPPLAEKELKTTFESILRREREKRLNADHQSTFSRATRRDPDTGRVVDEGWRLIIVTSDPPRYKVFSPLWEGFIDVGSTEMRSPEAICRAALEQCRVWIPGNFSKIWRGDKKNPSLAQQLMESAEIEEDADESRRPFLIAEMLYGFLTEMPKKISPGEEFDSRGLPCTTDRGDYVFKFTEAWRPMCRSDLKVRSHELTRLLRSLGCRPFFPTIAGRRYRLNLLQAEGFEQLRSRIMDVQ